MNIEFVEEIGIIAEKDDTVNSFYGVGGSLHNFFSKRVDEVLLGNNIMKEVKVDFGVIDPKGNINGLLGLDILMAVDAVIDLKDLTLSVNID